MPKRKKGTDLNLPTPKKGLPEPNVDLLDDVLQDAFALGGDEKIRISKLGNIAEIIIEEKIKG